MIRQNYINVFYLIFEEFENLSVEKKVNKRHVFKNFFLAIQIVSSFSQFPYNNATFEQYLPKFSLQNIEN